MRYILCFVVLFLVACLPGEGTADEGSATITKEVAAELLRGIQGEVVSAQASEIPGFYLIGMKSGERIIPLYLDQSGAFLISGNVINLKQRKNLTEKHQRAMNPVALDQIPLDDALLLGKADAATQVIVFTDPHCPFCSKLHQVMIEAVKDNPELAFQIKLLALKPSSRSLAKTIICNHSREQLDKAFSGVTLPTVECDTTAVDDNLALAKKLGIRGTPTLILPNGQIAPGYRPLKQLLELIKSSAAEPGENKP